MQGKVNEKKMQQLQEIYEEYIKEALNVKDIRRWCQKKTITESVMDAAKPGARKNESDVWNAVKNEKGIQQGDKIYTYPTILGHNIESGRIGKNGKALKDKVTEITGLKLDKYWKQDHDVEKLIERVWSTIEIFELVLDMSQFIDYSKKDNKFMLESMVPDSMKEEYSVLVKEHNEKIEKARKKFKGEK